jgi:hypothetical protein
MSSLALVLACEDSLLELVCYALLAPTACSLAPTAFSMLSAWASRASTLQPSTLKPSTTPTLALGPAGLSHGASRLSEDLPEHERRGQSCLLPARLRADAQSEPKLDALASPLASARRTEYTRRMSAASSSSNMRAVQTTHSNTRTHSRNRTHSDNKPESGVSMDSPGGLGERRRPADGSAMLTLEIHDTSTPQPAGEKQMAWDGSDSPASSSPSSSLLSEGAEHDGGGRRSLDLAHIFKSPLHSDFIKQMF